ncbi:hypothetical protein [Fusibacter ferrireducens]|uniref:Uncharacterized protein n=1 Tax=Fusibacter ferrireducens TaxID=2785058 RepID=A0ABR9ZPB4_9FIRM|nr:hypothetical protein [Fusibacter ferrireducens]MBF4692259.1 hypothetical protein [Fusibacter ferrireducens]
MDERLKFSVQITMLNHLKYKKLISTTEYDKIKVFIKKKYKIGIYALN